MSISPSLVARVRKLEQRAGIHRDTPVIGIVLRAGVTRDQALDRIRLAMGSAPVVYIANLARLRGLERNP